MYYNDGIPNCVPEYYREIQEREEHEYERMCKREAYYKESRLRLEDAEKNGYPVLHFSGYSECVNCKKKFDVQVDAEDDFCSLICYDKNCKCHKRK